MRQGGLLLLDNDVGIGSAYTDTWTYFRISFKRVPKEMDVWKYVFKCFKRHNTLSSLFSMMFGISDYPKWPPNICQLTKFVENSSRQKEQTFFFILPKISWKTCGFPFFLEVFFSYEKSSSFYMARWKVKEPQPSTSRSADGRPAASFRKLKAGNRRTMACKGAV